MLIQLSIHRCTWSGKQKEICSINTTLLEYKSKHTIHIHNHRSHNENFQCCLTLYNHNTASVFITLVSMKCPREETNTVKLCYNGLLLGTGLKGPLYLKFVISKLGYGQLTRLGIFTVHLHWPHQSVYTTTYPHPGSDCLFAKGRRSLVTRLTITWKPMLSIRLLSTGTRAFSNDIKWPRQRDGNVSWCAMRLRNHNMTTAVLMKLLSWLCNHAGRGLPLN